MSDLAIKGKVVNILELVSGVSKAGKDWQKQEFVIETDGDYPKQVCFTLFGDKTELVSKLSIGAEVNVFFNVESREYNGRYFHSVNAWRVDVEEAQASESYSNSEDQNTNSNETADDDLPF